MRCLVASVYFFVHFIMQHAVCRHCHISLLPLYKASRSFCDAAWAEQASGVYTMWAAR